MDDVEPWNTLVALVNSSPGRKGDGTLGHEPWPRLHGFGGSDGPRRKYATELYSAGARISAV